MLIQSGILVGVDFLISPYQDARPEACVVDLLVVHGISLPPGQFGGGYVSALFQGRLTAQDHPDFKEVMGLAVSAHVFIDRQGKTTQYVSFDRRAWHAGLSSFQGKTRCNDFSIGIELEGTDHRAYEQVQYQRLATVATALMCAYPHITPERMVGHSDIAPGRKTDPGPAFDWSYFLGLL